MENFDYEQMRTLLRDLAASLDMTSGDKLTHEGLEDVIKALTEVADNIDDSIKSNTQTRKDYEYFASILSEKITKSRSNRRSKKDYDDSFDEYRMGLMKSRERDYDNVYRSGFQRYFKDLNDANEYHKRQKRIHRESTVFMENQFGFIGRGLSGFGRNITNINGNLTSLVATLGLGIIGFTAVNNAVNSIDKTIDSYRSMANFGQSFSGDILTLRDAATSAKMTLEDFTDSVVNGSQGLRMLGVTNFGKISKTVRETFSEVGMLGLTTKEVNQIISDYLDYQKTTGSLEKINDKTFNNVLRKLIYNSTELSAAFGISRDEILKASNELTKAPDFQSLTADLDPFLKRELGNVMAVIEQSMPGLSDDILAAARGIYTPDFALAAARNPEFLNSVKDAVTGFISGPDARNVTSFNMALKQAGQEAVQVIGNQSQIQNIVQGDFGKLGGQMINMANQLSNINIDAGLASIDQFNKIEEKSLLGKPDLTLSGLQVDNAVNELNVAIEKLTTATFRAMEQSLANIIHQFNTLAKDTLPSVSNELSEIMNGMKGNKVDDFIGSLSGSEIVLGVVGLALAGFSFKLWRLHRILKKLDHVTIDGQGIEDIMRRNSSRTTTRSTRQPWNRNGPSYEPRQNSRYGRDNVDVGDIHDGDRTQPRSRNNQPSDRNSRSNTFGDQNDNPTKPKPRSRGLRQTGFGKGVKAAGIAGSLLALGLSTYDIYDQYKILSDEVNQGITSEKDMNVEISKEVGDAIGSTAGAALGPIAAGALAGSVFGGLGAIPGALIGLLFSGVFSEIGGEIGSVVGETVGNTIYQDEKKQTILPPPVSVDIPKDFYDKKDKTPSTETFSNNSSVIQTNIDSELVAERLAKAIIEKLNDINLHISIYPSFNIDKLLRDMQVSNFDNKNYDLSKIDKKTPVNTTYNNISNIEYNDQNNISNIEYNDQNNISNIEYNDQNNISNIEYNDQNNISNVEYNDQNNISNVYDTSEKDNDTKGSININKNIDLPQLLDDKIFENRYFKDTKPSTVSLMDIFDRNDNIGTEPKNIETSMDDTNINFGENFITSYLNYNDKLNKTLSNIDSMLSDISIKHPEHLSDYDNNINDISKKSFVQDNIKDKQVNYPDLLNKITNKMNEFQSIRRSEQVSESSNGSVDLKDIYDVIYGINDKNYYSLYDNFIPDNIAVVDDTNTKDTNDIDDQISSNKSNEKNNKLDEILLNDNSDIIRKDIQSEYIKTLIDRIEAQTYLMSDLLSKIERNTNDTKRNISSLDTRF